MTDTNSDSSDSPKSGGSLIEEKGSSETITLLNKSTKNTSFLSVILRIIYLAVTMALSYTFSLSLLAMALMMNFLADKQKNDEYSAAIPLINTAMLTIILLIVSILFPMSIVGGKRLGELRLLEENEASENELIEKREQIRLVYRSGLSWVAFCTPPAIIIMSQLETILKDWFQQDPIVAAIAGRYLRLYAIALPGYLLRMVAEQMLFIYGKTFIAMIIGLSNFFIGTGLAAGLTFGSPDLDEDGIAIGYIVESYLMAICYMLFIAFHKDYRPLKLFSLSKWFRELFGTLKEITKLGLPITVQLSAEVFIDYLLAIFAGWLGNDALSTLSIVILLNSLLIIPILAFGNSATQEVSRAIGQKDFLRAQKVSRMGPLSSVMIITLTSVIFSPSIISLAKLFTHRSLSSKSIADAEKITPIAVIVIIFNALRYSMIEILRPANKGMLPGVISVACLAAGLPLAYFLGFQTKLGILGLELGLMFSMIMSVVVLGPLFYKFTEAEYLAKIQTQKTSGSILEKCYRWCLLSERKKSLSESNQEIKKPSCIMM